MGEAELHTISQQLIIHSVIVCYGDASTPDLTIKIANDISLHWNEPEAQVAIKGKWYTVRFEIEAIHEPDLDPEKVWYNDNPRFNFFRIEEFAETNVSFVDAIGSNTGYFKLEDVVRTTTTAAHEYGHTIGLEHPTRLDIRGKGAPGIMYPRGTICDPVYQYDANANPGSNNGGTLNPIYRRVLPSDINDLKLQRLLFNNGRAVVGEFSSIYHDKQLPVNS